MTVKTAEYLEEFMKRREAREQAFVLIFEHQANNETIKEIVDMAESESSCRIDSFAEKEALGVEQNVSAIDAEIEKYIRGWKMKRLSRVSLALLRLAVYEIMFEKEIPNSVSINEAVELAKKYGGKEDAPFVNGVLASVVRGIAPSKEENSLDEQQ